MAAMESAMLALKEGCRLRQLGMQETMWHEVFKRLGGTGLLQYSLVIDSDRQLEQTDVGTALGALQRQLPLMRTRVEQLDNVNYLVAGRCPNVPLTVLPPGGDWLAEHHRQLREQTIDTSAGPLWKASLLNDPAGLPAPATSSHRAVIYLSICHTITDGISNALICGQLLENLDRVMSDRELDVSEPAPVHPSVDELVRPERVPLSLGLARAFLYAVRPVLSRRRHPFLETFVAPFDPALPPDSYWNQMLAAALSAEETARLRAQCRRCGVSVNSALSAAVSLAGARLMADPPADTALPTMWLVNARRYLPPARGLQLSTVSGALATVRVGRASFWRLAAQIDGMLSSQLKAKLPLVPLKLMCRFLTQEKITAGLEKSAASPSASAFVYNINNVGSLDGIFPQTKAVRVVELHRTFRAHPAMDSSFGSHCFHTVGGRLCYDLNFLHGRVREEDAKRFSGMVLDALKEASTPSESS